MKRKKRKVWDYREIQEEEEYRTEGGGLKRKI